MNNSIAMLKLNEAFAIMKKELRGYFVSPIAYIVITIFLVFTGFFFFKDFFIIKQAEMRRFFQLIPLMLTFVVPAITMRLFAEERHSGSIEILLTLPISTRDVVLGKFFAGTLFVAIMMIPTLLYVITVVIVGSPDIGPIIGGYIGVILLGAAYTSVGLLTSSLTHNQIVAFIIGWFSCFSLWLIDKVVSYLPGIFKSIEYVGTDFHFQGIARGVIDTRNIIYFVSVITIMILFTIKILDERR